jgi:hypothetical protein
MLVGGIDRQLSCPFPQQFPMAATVPREMATQSRRESSSEVHAY